MDDLQTVTLSESQPAPLNPLFRPAQYDILRYEKGKLGVAAVPGSGKTFTLAHLAAALVRKLAARNDPEPAEVLIVTFTNVAAESFKRRLSDILRQRRVMLPYAGFRVRTLHGLAHDILQERPALVGLADDFAIADERTTAALIGDVVRTWWNANADWFIEQFVNSEELAKKPTLRTEQLPAWLIDVGATFIRSAKDRELDPAKLRSLLTRAEKNGKELALARIGLEWYEAYQRSLTTRNAVDFDDLARLALRALRSDTAFRRRLQKRWPFVLEDEAQDSSKLQQEMLGLLSEGKNWVRVGDPNQAINTTFTTANPDFLRGFLADRHVTVKELDQAGRSAQPIINLANELVHWAVHEHPVPDLQNALHDQLIRPTSPGDRQGNPTDDESALYVRYTPGKSVTTDDELKFVVDSLSRWLPDHANQTVAVLVPDNARGYKLVERLRSRQIPYEELLNSTSGTREAARLLHDVLGYLAAPVSSRVIGLPRLYKDVWWPFHLGRLAESAEEAQESRDLQEQVIQFLREHNEAERWLWPDPAQSESEGYGDLPQELVDDLEAFRFRVRRWLDAAILPIDQLILTIDQDLFNHPADLALGYKFASLLRSTARRFPTWRLPEFVDELDKISQNQRKFLGFESEDLGYQPTPGQVTVSTYHRAKGLEWDRVYLTGVSNYVFPALQADDTYLDEKYYIRGKLNLRAEALAQLETLIHDGEYVEGNATERARIDYAAERLRLLYVGITRARRELCLSWNTGHFGGNRPALALIALTEHLRTREPIE